MCSTMLILFCLMAFHRKSPGQIFPTNTKRLETDISDTSVASACDGGKGCSHVVNMKPKADRIILWRNNMGRTWIINEFHEGKVQPPELLTLGYLIMSDIKSTYY